MSNLYDQNAEFVARKIQNHVELKGGKFYLDHDNKPCLKLGLGPGISIDYSKTNDALAKLFLDVCNISTFGRVAQMAISRLRVVALERGVE